MTSGWEGFIHMMEHKFNKKKQQWTKTHIVNSAAIYGKDGTPWAVSHNWPGLQNYEVTEETEYGPKTNQVNEFATMDSVSGGIRKPGISIGQQKYTFVKFD